MLVPLEIVELNVKTPLTLVVPTTSNLYAGDIVPIPTSPIKAAVDPV